jgi:hypothetical protein
MRKPAAFMRARAVLAAVGAALSLLAAPGPAAGEDVRGGIIRGDGWTFMAMAPEGWVWDPITLRGHGVQGLFYLAGTIYDPTSLHLFVSPSPKGPASPRDLARFVAADEVALRRLSPGISVRRLPPLETGPGYSFVRVSLDDAANGYFQEIAYLDGEACYFSIVLSCRSAAERGRRIGAFEELVDSFTLIEQE